MPQKTHWVIQLKKYAVILLVSLLLLGCAGKEDIVKKVEERHLSLDGYSGSVFVINNITGDSFKVDLWIKKPGKQKIVYTYPEDVKGASIICNGSIVWFYNPSENSAVYASVGETQMPDFDYGNLFKTIIDNSTIEEVSEVKTNGKEEYLIIAKPNDTAGRDITIKIWIDKELLYPSQIKWLVEGEEVYRVEYQNITFDVASDDIFEFSPPEGADVMSIEELRSGGKVTVSSIDEAQEMVDFKIFVPAYLPAEDFNLTIDVLKRYGTVVLTYFNDTTVLEIREKAIDPFILVPEGAEELTIGNNTAYFLDVGYVKILMWDYGNTSITMSGSLEKEEMIKIAESMS